MKFDTLNLDPKLMDGIRKLGYERCTPVQEQTLPESLQGRDVSAQAQTGTGKTAVFLITIIQRMIDSKKSGDHLRALILVPTRELAVQVEKQAIALCKHLQYKTVCLYGGVGYDKQLQDMKKACIAIATPGRLIDLVKSRQADISKLEYFVIDEADRMFDMGFLPDVRYIMRKIPRREKRQTMLFSATLDSRIRQIASSYMRDTVEIEIDPEQVTVGNVEQSLFHVSREEKMPLLLALIKREEMPKLIIFTNMKRTAEEVAFKLNGNGIPADAITGDLDQKKRLRLIEKMQKGGIKILVATDVAARGLHIDDVTHVINYDLPTETANYVHRVGRTARAGAKGVAYTLACEDLVENLPLIERYIEHKIKVEFIDFTLPEDKAGRYRQPRRGERPAQGHGRRDGGRRPPARERPAKRPAGDGKKSAHPKKVSVHAARHDKPSSHARPEKKQHKRVSEDERLAYYGKKPRTPSPKKSGEHSAHRPKKKTAPKSLHAVKHRKHETKSAPAKKKGIIKTLLGAFRKKPGGK